MKNQILTGDCLASLKTLPAQSVHCCVTSPPYWGLRQYLIDGAVVLRNDLTEAERLYVLNELTQRGIQPAMGGK